MVAVDAWCGFGVRPPIHQTPTSDILPGWVLTRRVVKMPPRAGARANNQRNGDGDSIHPLHFTPGSV